MVFTKLYKFMKVGLLCLTMIVIGMQVTFAQNAFHRNYPATENRDVLAISSTQLIGGDYATLEAQLNFGSNNAVYSDTVIITCYKPKGDIKWSKSIYLGSGYTGFQYLLGSIVQASNDTIYYSLISRNTDKPNVLIGSISMEGDLGFLRSYGYDKNSGDALASANLLAEFNKTMYNTNSLLINNEQNLSLSRNDYLGNSLWAKTLSAKSFENNENLDETVIDFSINNDSTLLFTGIVDSNNITPFLLVTDTLGNPIWSRRYTDIQSFAGFPFSYSAKQLPDSSFVMVGYLLEVVLPINFLIRGFIIKTDKTGEIEWSKRVIFNNFDQTLLNKVIVDANGHLIVSGISGEENENAGFSFLVKLDGDGNVLWKKKYPKSESLLNLNGNLFNTVDRGYGLTCTSIIQNRFAPSFLKLDGDGKSTCEEDILEEIFFNSSFSTDTLIWETKDEVLLVDDVMKSTSVFQYEVPVLRLSVRPFCPDEPIDWTFSATTFGATFYEWSTGLKGENADSLRVFEEGEYSVTVTMDKDVCFMLCDTIKLERYNEPSVEINLSLGNFCTNGKQTLIMGYQPGHPELKSIAWSTGESTPTIEISNPGTYAITIVDQCDETATATIDVGPFPTKITAATISDQITVNCLNGTVSGILSGQGNSTGLGSENYLWSNGANTKEITINDSNILTFTVTVTDGCGTTATATKVIELKGAGISSVDIQEDPSRKCSEGIIVLNAVTNVFSPNLMYNWSNGTTTGNLITNNAGTYSVTVSDRCGNIATASTSVSFTGSPGFGSLRIVADSTSLCADSIIKLVVIPQIQGSYTFRWSTSNTTETISIKRSGLYSVTVTDFCGNSQVLQYDYKYKRDVVTIEKGKEILCSQRKIILKPIISPDPGFKVPFQYTFIWADGQTTGNIEISMAGSYTVTVTDICKNTATANVAVTASDFDIEDLIKGITISNEVIDDCSGIIVKAVINPDNQSIIKDITWSTGEKTKEIVFTGPKTYSVTITDVCDKTYTASSEIGASDINADIQYANIFFPEGAVTVREAFADTTENHRLTARYNRTFGPIPLDVYCLDKITNYEFYVFNRWGQLVFESNRVSDEWDGEHNDQKAPTETYMWVVKYTIFGVEKVKKGSVTLLRP